MKPIIFLTTSTQLFNYFNVNTCTYRAKRPYPSHSIQSINMSESCAECNVDITSNDDNIGCNGMCSNKYHLSCLSRSNKHYKKSIVTLLMHVPNLHWYCNDCLPYTLEGAFGGLKRKLFECSAAAESIMSPLLKLQQQSGSVSIPLSRAVQMPYSPQHQAHKQLHQQQIHPTLHTTKQAAHSIEEHGDLPIVSENGSSHDDMLVDVPNGQPMPNSLILINSPNRSEQNRPTAMKRRLDEPSSPKRRKIENFSKKAPLLSQMVAIKENGSNKRLRSIYVTPFKPETSPDAILKHIKSIANFRVLADKIKCIKLMSDRKNPKNIHFVSFKLDVPSEYFSSFLDPSIWPSGITAKEFSETQMRKKNENSRENKTSNISERTSHMSKNGKRDKRLPTQRNRGNRARPKAKIPSNRPMSYSMMPPQSMMHQPWFIPNPMNHSMYPSFLNQYA